MKRLDFQSLPELRPRHCVLAGASGTHSVCVRNIHQNVKLMIHGVKLGEFSTPDGTSFSYQDCIAKAICNPPLPTCYIGTCNQ